MTQSWPSHRRATPPLGRTQEFLRQIVYGGNDGIVTTFAIVSGFAGASASGAAEIGAAAVLVFGLANLFADGVSMGLGAVLSTRSQRELYRARLQEREVALARDPVEERRSLVALLRDRGMAAGPAQDAADALMRSPAFLADFLTAQEVEGGGKDAPRASVQGAWTFASFVALGFVPLAPFVALPPTAPATFPLSVAATFAALAGLGLLRGRATGERLARSVGETVLVGGICAAVAFVVGRLVGG